MTILNQVIKKSKQEDGNVLFLILIAVALFAALSYAVTSSTRSSGGSAGRETSLVNSSQITQYPASISTAIVRMIMDGTDVEDIRFNRPSEFSTLDSNEIGVFHPDGGGATYIQAPADFMADGNAGDWTFNAENWVNDIGIDDSGTADGSEIIAFLTGIKKTICKKINEEHGIATTLVITTTQVDDATRMSDTGTDYTFPATATTGTEIDNTGTDYDGQPFGCFYNKTDTDYVYYHVVVER